jgi:hypothetical protein
MCIFIISLLLLTPLVGFSAQEVSAQDELSTDLGR